MNYSAPTNFTFHVDDLLIGQVKKFDSAKNLVGYVEVMAQVDQVATDGSVEVSIIKGENYLSEAEYTDGLPMVRFGNKTNKNRQGSLLFNLSGEGAPYIAVLDEINSPEALEDPANVKGVFGKLDETLDRYLKPKGYGLFSTNAYLRGTIALGKAYSLTEGTGLWASHNMATDKVEFRVGNITADNYFSYEESTGELKAVLNKFDFKTPKFRINSAEETILFGAAKDYLTGIGIFQGKDKDSVYKTRIGDPEKCRFQYNGEAIEVYDKDNKRVFVSNSTGTNVAGWSSTDTQLFNGTDIVLDAANKKIALNNSSIEFGFEIFSDTSGTKYSGLKFNAYNYWYSDYGFRAGGATANFIKSQDGTLTLNSTDFNFSAANFSIVSGDKASISVSGMKFGLNVSGTSSGLFINDGNNWFSDGKLTVGIASKQRLNFDGSSLSIYDKNNVKIFSSDNSGMALSGWTATIGKLSAGTDIVLDSANKYISIANGSVILGFEIATLNSVKYSGLRLDQYNYWLSGLGFRAGGTTSNYIRSEGGILTLNSTDFNFSATNFSLVSGTNAVLSVGPMKFGLNVSGTNSGLFINDGNNWFSDGKLSVGIASKQRLIFDGSSLGIYDKDNNKIFASDSNGIGISGWSAAVNKLFCGTDIVLDAANKKIALNNSSIEFGFEIFSDTSGTKYSGLKFNAYNYWYSAYGFRAGGATANFIKSQDGTLTLNSTDFNFSATNFSIVSGDNASISISGMKFGLNVTTINNVQKNGLFLDADNYWLHDKTFKVGSSTRYLLWDASNVSVRGDVTAEHLTATVAGKIAIWDINSTSLSTGEFYTQDKMYFGTYGLSISNKFKVDSGGALTSTSGTIGGWIIGENTITSGLTNNPRITLDKTLMRISVIDSANIEKVAMGYLGGLPKNDGTGNWDNQTYGFWARQGDKLKIDGNAEYVKGDWI
ncbi:MAG: hypothetical protein ACM34K_17100, partial [Bacillota bacterium]